MLRPFLDTAFVNLVDLMEVINIRVGEFQTRASEEAVRAKIAIMRNPAGRTESEIANANAIADRLEPGLGDGLKLDPGADKLRTGYRRRPLSGQRPPSSAAGPRCRSARLTPSCSLVAPPARRG